jgi:hypothetical protein
MATFAGRATSSYRLRPTAPAGAQRWRHGEQWSERPALAQFVYLAMLLHAIAILLFGAPPGGSRDGRAMWGALNVVLQGPVREIPALAPRLERELKIPPVPAPAPAKRAAPAPRKEAAPIDVPRIVPPMMERIAPPPLKLDKALPTPKIEVIAVPAPPPIAIPPPLQPIVPELPRIERAIADVPKIEAPLAQPIAPAAVVQRPVEVAPPVAVPAPMQPIVPEAARVERALADPPQITAPPAPAQEFSQPALPTRIAPPLPPPPVVEKREAPSSGYDPTQPSIDLDAARRRASQMAREGAGQRALLPFPMPAPPERKTKTEEALDKARKPDCRTAYKELGLLAVAPLIANEFGEGNCRW